MLDSAVKMLKQGIGIDSSSEIGSTVDDGRRARGSRGSKRQRLAEDYATAALSNHVAAASDRIDARLESHSLHANVSSLCSRLAAIENNISRTELRVDTMSKEVEQYEDLLRESKVAEDAKTNGYRLARRRKELDKLRASLVVLKNDKDIVRDELAVALARQRAFTARLEETVVQHRRDTGGAGDIAPVQVIAVHTHNPS